MSQALIKAARVSIAGNVRGYDASQASTTLRPQHRTHPLQGRHPPRSPNPDHYASRKAFRGKKQLFAKNHMGGLMVRDNDTRLVEVPSHEAESPARFRRRSGRAR